MQFAYKKQKSGIPFYLEKLIHFSWANVIYGLTGLSIKPK